ncbi:MAG TPA: hypothetical protein VN621_10935 [Arthrobacter sp.]|nr:hypothetical protein [Arthrobacter sp.]
MTSQPLDLEPRPDFSDRVRAVLQASAEGAAAARGTTGLGETETLQLFLLDGLLEAVEWANDGVAADEAACLWLAGLRWYRARTGTFPVGTPEPLPRWIDRELEALPPGPAPSGSEPSGSAHAGWAPGDRQDAIGLSAPEMGSTGRPVFPTADGPGVLPRAAAMALLPRVDQATTARLAADAAALTHGAPAAHRAAGLAATAVRAGLEHGTGATRRWTELLEDAGTGPGTQEGSQQGSPEGSQDGNDGGSLAALRLALAAAMAEVESRQEAGARENHSAGAAGGGPTGQDATAVVHRLGRDPDPSTASYAAALVASACGHRRPGDRQATAADPLIGQLHRRWIEAVLGTAP